MKKLMIVATVALMAVCSQAATFKWTATGMTDYSGAAISSVLATVYCVETGTAVGSATISSGSVASTLLEKDDFTASTYYNFYLTSTDAAGNVFTSANKKSKAQSASTPNLSFVSTGGSWSTVPEPTSAMLLLLGVAGLALKRKRA